MSILPSAPKQRALLVDKITAFNKHQTLKEAASDAQKTISSDVKDMIGLPPAQFTRMCKIAALLENDLTKLEQLRELDENIYTEVEMLFPESQV